MMRIRRLLSPPVFEDEELTRRAGLLNAVAWPSLAIAIGLGITLLLSGSSPIVLLTVAAMTLIIAITLIWMRRGKLHSAALLFVFAGWTVTVLPAFFQDGLSSPYVLFSIVMVLLASLLLERRYVQWVTALSLLAATGMLLNEYYTFLPQVIPVSTPVRRWASLLAALLSISVIVQLAMDSLRAAVERAWQNQRRLEESNRMLEETQAVLERRVAERTAALEQRANQLQSAAEVAAAVASIRDLDALLDEIAHLISGRFGFYHVGIYLLDETGKKLTLRAANTEAGRRLIEKGFELPLDQPSMAASVAKTRQVRVAADVSADEQYLALEELSMTRSEIVLPLISGDKLMGVLDLQDTIVRAPSSDELTALRILANQTAIAMDNAQLFAAHQKTMESLQRAYGALSREGWRQMLRSQPELGFLATEVGAVQPIANEWTPEMKQAQQSGRVVQADAYTLIAPIQIREQAMGVVRLRKPQEAGVWARSEIELVQTLCNRLSAALESARLYEETRRRAERERLTSEITARIRASNDPRVILQTAAHELRRALHASQAQLLVQATPLQAAPTEPTSAADASQNEVGTNGRQPPEAGAPSSGTPQGGENP